MNNDYKRGTVLRLKDNAYNPTALVGRMVYVVRQSKRTGSLTVAMLDYGAGYDKGETLVVAPYQVELTTQTR